MGFYGPVDSRSGFFEIVEIHGGVELHLSVEGEKPWFRNSRDLGWIFQIKEDESGALAVVFGEVCGFRFDLRDDGLDGAGQTAVSDGGVPCLNRNGNFEQATHEKPPGRRV